MISLHRRSLIGILLALVLLAAACGQKAGVHVATGASAGAVGVDGSGSEALVEGDAAAGDVAGAGDAATGDVAGAAGAAGGAAGAAGGATGSGGGGAKAPTQGAVAAGGKAWGDTVVIGIHAPLTGAAPLPAASFEKGKDLYVKYINDKGGIHGRKLAVEFLDDEYQPATAVSKCKQLVEQKKAFMLFGGGGTDQIQACARYAAQVGVPYMSAGVTEVNMRSLKNYFAASMSYPQQAPYLARYIKKNFAGQKVGMVYSNTKNFFDARDAFVKEIDSELFQMSRLPSQSEIAQTAQQMCAKGIKVGFILTTPTTYIALANQVKSQCGAIQWTGVGITMGLNAVAGTGCQTNQAVDKGIFLSPVPGVDKMFEVDPEFKAAIDKYNGGSYDDIFALLWGGTKVAGEILKAAGPNLTRASFIAAAEKTTIAPSMYPGLQYSPTNHFGAKTVHVIQADCAGGYNKYRTLQTNAQF